VEEGLTRATQVFLTAEGKKKLALVALLNDELNRFLRRGFSEAEIDVVLRFLNEVLAKSRRPEDAPFT
jgi:DNA-binding MarR family transcriptional regulator